MYKKLFLAIIMLLLVTTYAQAGRIDAAEVENTKSADLKMKEKADTSPVSEKPKNFDEPRVITDILYDGLYPQPVAILASVSSDYWHLSNLQVTAKVDMPDGKSVTVSLRDDGRKGDYMPNDGLYSGVLTDFSIDGIYTFKVTAISSATSPAKSMFGENTEIAPFNVTSDKGQFEVTGIASRNEIKVIGKHKTEYSNEYFWANKVWGELTANKSDGAWFRFRIEADDLNIPLHIQTHSLYAYGDSPIKTRLVLYRSEIKELMAIAEPIQSHSIAYTKFTPYAMGLYYVQITKPKHSDGGDGIFALSISTHCRLMYPLKCEDY